MVDFAVITFVHRNEQFLKNCIKGLLTQNINFQWHLLCYAPPKEDLKGLKPIIHILNDKIGNKAQAYNLILPQLTEKYIAYNDADDISLPNRFEKQINFLEKNKDIDILGGGLIINETHPGWSVYKQHRQITNFMVINNPMVNSTVMLRNKVNFWGIKVKYNETLHRAEDYDFWLQCAKQNLKFANLKEALISYFYVEKDNSLERNYAKLIREEAFYHFTGKRLKDSFRKDLHQFGEEPTMNSWKRFWIATKIKLYIYKNNLL